MYGLVNRAVEDYTIKVYGEGTWRGALRRAGVTAEPFVSLKGYPDELTYSLVGAVCEETGITGADLLEQLGRHWIEFAAKSTYGDLFALSGSTFPDFLRNLDGLHARLGRSLPELKPPSFRCSDVGESQLTLHYYSHRSGLQPFVVGLLKGLGERFQLRVEAELVKPRGEGQDHDEFSVRFMPF